MLKLRNWVNIQKLNWNYLCKNPNAIELLKINKDKINWDYLCKNTNLFVIYFINVKFIKFVVDL
jgi:hypothetical protein